MNRRRPSFGARIYGWLLLLLPAPVRRRDREEMLLLFDELWQEAAGGPERLRVAFRTYGRVPAVLLKEWFRESTRPRKGSIAVWFGSLRFDFRVGARALAKTPLPTSIAIGTVAAAIALTTLTLSTVYGTLLRPLPFESAERVMAISWVNADFEARDLQYYRDRQTAFERVEAYTRRRVSVLGLSDFPESVQAAFVTASALAHLGVAPVLGRLFPAGEGLTEPVEHVVLGYDLWLNRYAGDPAVIGRRLRVDGHDLEILGVMPEGFAFPVMQSMWLPLDVGFGDGPGSGRSFSVFGRLNGDRSQSYAASEAEAIAEGLRTDFPSGNPPEGAIVTPFARRHLPEGIDSLLFVILGSVVAVLLIACSNLTNLLLARATIRRREVAICGALGASRARIVQQFLVEALVLSMAGTALGLCLALLGLDVLTDAVSNVRLPYWVEYRVDGPILAITASLMIGVALFAGTVPAIRALRGDARPALGNGDRGSSAGQIGRAGSALVTAQITLSLALLVAAGLLIKSAIRLDTMDRGFDTEEVLAAQINLSEVGHPNPDRVFLNLVEELEALPSIDQAALARNAPGTGGTFAWDIWVQGEEYGPRVPTADGKNIGHGYFETLGIDLLEGRDFTSTESLYSRAEGGPHVVIVNRLFAQRHLGSSPVGRRIQFGSHDPEEPWYTVVGVVEDGYVGSNAGGIGLTTDSNEQMYIPWGAAQYRSGTLLLRTRGEPEASISDVRAILAQIAPNTPLTDPSRLTHRVEETTWAFGLFGRAFTAFGAVALLISMAGLYGVIAFNMSQRRREMGTRMALGADSGAIVRLSLYDGSIQLLLGMAFGSLAGFLLATALESVTFGVSVGDAQVYAYAIGLVGLAGGLATLIPSLSTARLDPLEALRSE
jgi:putative ABC transport system permease protein